MWPVPELRVPLPEDLHACEDADFLVVRCRRCAWAACFIARSVRIDHIRRAAETHVAECPAR